MKINLSSSKFTKIFSLFYFFLIFFVMLFGRTFTGLYVFNLRLGEVIIALCFLLSCFLLFYNKKIFNQSKLLSIHKMIVIIFFLNVTISSGSLLSTYTYKTSSYIWTLIFLYLGNHFFNYLENNKFKIEKIMWALPLRIF